MSEDGFSYVLTVKCHALGQLCSCDSRDGVENVGCEFQIEDTPDLSIYLHNVTCLRTPY